MAEEKDKTKQEEEEVENQPTANKPEVDKTEEKPAATSESDSQTGQAEPQETKEPKKEEPKKEEPKKEEPKKEEPKKEEPKVADQAKKEVKIPAKFKDLVKKIEEMNIMDLAELVKILEEKFGVLPMSAATISPTVASLNGEEEEKEEKTEFTVELKDAGSQKIQAIKVVRDITGKGLRESKDLVDKAPQVIKENVKKEEAEEMKKKLEEAGATVALK